MPKSNEIRALIALATLIVCLLVIAGLIVTSVVESIGVIRSACESQHAMPTETCFVEMTR